MAPLTEEDAEAVIHAAYIDWVKSGPRAEWKQDHADVAEFIVHRLHKVGFHITPEAEADGS